MPKGSASSCKSHDLDPETTLCTVFFGIKSACQRLGRFIPWQESPSPSSRRPPWPNSLAIQTTNKCTGVSHNITKYAGAGEGNSVLGGELLPCRAPTSLPPKELSFRPFRPHTVLVPDLTDHKTTTATPGRDARSCKRDIDKRRRFRRFPRLDTAKLYRTSQSHQRAC